MPALFTSNEVVGLYITLHEDHLAVRIIPVQLKPILITPSSQGQGVSSETPCPWEDGVISIRRGGEEKRKEQ